MIDLVETYARFVAKCRDRGVQDAEIRRHLLDDMKIPQEVVDELVPKEPNESDQS